MSNYSQVTDFSDKDALTTGDPEKAISGADVDAELSAIATAITSKQVSIGTGLAGQVYGQGGWQSGSWSVVSVNDISSDATWNFYHDGFDGSTDFIAEWEYRARFHNLYGTANEFLLLELYEGGAYRQADYARIEQGSTDPTVSADATIGTAAYGSGRWGSTNATGWSGTLELLNMANTKNFQVLVNGYSYATTQRKFEAESRPNALSLETGVTTHIKCTPNSGSATGRVIFERRYVGT